MSTQTPLLLEKRTMPYLPMFLNVFVLTILGLAAYTYIYLHGFSSLLVWGVFGAKMSLAGAMLALQLLSINKTKLMIQSIPSLELNKPAYYQTVFIFVIFAVNVVLQSLSRVLFTDLRNTIDT